MFKKFGFVLLLALLAFPVYNCVLADEDIDEDKARKLEQDLAMKREKPPEVIIEEIIQAKRPRPTLPEGKTAIKQVAVVGATVLSQAEINKITQPYANRELNAAEMQKCVDLISDTYTRKGFVTSYAYIIPDKLAEGTLQIMCQEGKVGDIEVKENQYFSTRVIERKITLTKGEVFSVKKLQGDLYRINRSIDRKAHFLLKQGKEPGTTDIVLLVKDKWPFHTILQADNYGSEYILMKRYKLYLIDNNLTGHDDSLQAKAQMTEAYTHKLFDLDYFLPLNNKWKFEFYYMPYKKENYVYDDNETTDFEKRARKSYFYFTQALIEEPNFDLSFQYGFKYVDIYWYSYGHRVKWDKFRPLMWGFDLNRADKWGRWVITDDLEIGLPGILGGAEAKDDHCSVLSAGGAYKKNHLVVARRQKLTKDIDFLFKSHWQMCSQTVTGVNNFSVGGFYGVIDNRGYPRAQAPGDGGQSITAGFSFPAYFVPRSFIFPFSKAKLYDSVKLFTFFDWSEAVLKSPKNGDDKKTTLASAGWGLTFNLPENFSARLDMGWPVSSETPKDGSMVHVWWSATKSF